MSDVSVDEVLTSCPQCGGPVIIVPGVYFPAQLVCAECGFDLWKWFREPNARGGKCPKADSDTFFMKVRHKPSPISSASGKPKLPSLLAPFTLTEHELNRSMMGNCDTEEKAPAPQRLPGGHASSPETPSLFSGFNGCGSRPQSATAIPEFSLSSARCSPEPQHKLRETQRKQVKVKITCEGWSPYITTIGKLEEAYGSAEARLDWYRMHGMKVEVLED